MCIKKEKKHWLPFWPVMKLTWFPNSVSCLEWHMKFSSRSRLTMPAVGWWRVWETIDRTQNWIEISNEWSEWWRRKRRELRGNQCGRKEAKDWMNGGKEKERRRFGAFALLGWAGISTIYFGFSERLSISIVYEYGEFSLLCQIHSTSTFTSTTAFVFHGSFGFWSEGRRGGHQFWIRRSSPHSSH